MVFPRLVIWHRPHVPHLRLLAGTRSQQTALVAAIRPVVRDFTRTLAAAGVEVSSIVLMPALCGDSREPLQAEIEQLDGSRSFTIRLAYAVRGVLRRPDEVAGALAQELLYLYREVAPVTVVRQTPVEVFAPAPVAVPVGRSNVRSVLATQPRAGAAKDEAL